MRKQELRIIDEKLIRKTKEFENGENWQPWQISSWRCLRERTVEILYQGPNVKISEKKIPEPFFELSERYIGLLIDPKINADIGLDLLIIPHYSDSAPPILCLTYSVDVWPMELLLVFKKRKFILNSGDPLAEGMLVYRSQTEVKKVFGEEENKILEKREDISKNRELATRKYNFSGTELDNYYEIARRKAKMPPRATPIIFKRGYAK